MSKYTKRVDLEEFETLIDAFHHLMDQHYDGASRNEWVIAEMDHGFFEVMSQKEAEDDESVRDFYTFRFNPDYSTTLELWSTGEDFITFQEGQ